MQPTDDSALLQQYLENHSDEAFAELVERHLNLVYSVALRQVGDSHAAEEISQVVFVILAKKATQLRHEKALSSWLFQATRLTANNFIRSEMRRHRREEEAYMQSVLEGGSGAPPHQTPEIWPQIAPWLDDAVAKLHEKDRRAIVLRFYEGRNMREVGLALDTSEDAAEKRVSRALEKLRKRFTKRGVDSTAAIIAGAISTHSVQAAPVAQVKIVTAMAITKGAAASGSTLTLIKGALKIMAWTKAKTAIIVGVGAALLLLGGAIALKVANRNVGDKSTAGEILQKAQASYDALSSYSDSGKSINETSGRSQTSAFAVKFARPDRWVVQGTQTVGQTSHTMTFWPADGQVFMLADQARYFSLAENDDHLLQASTGNSAASGLSVAGIFFHKNWDVSIEKLATNPNVSRQSDEKVAGVNCYVLATTVLAYKVTLWIGQKDFLIRQRNIVSVPQPNPQDNWSFTETHTDIQLNKVFSADDLKPRIPDGVKLETKPIR
jgi:RNA polymerase sigma factor (sigma-70 family)